MPGLILPPIAQLSTLPGSLLPLGVQKLPASPTLERLAFEQPWMSMLVLVLAGLAALWALSRRNQARKGQLVFGIGLVLAAANFLVSMLVTTTRETISALSRQAITHVTSGDAASLGPLLRSDVVVYPFGVNRDRVLEQVTTLMRGQYAVKDPNVLEMLVVQDSVNAVRSQFRLRVTPTSLGYGFPVASWWMLTWQRDTADGNWLISRIECQQIDGVSSIENIRP